MRFDLVDLQLFIETVDAGSITRGAARANLALASASARIRTMEAKVGTALLNRGRRGVAPTAAGRCVLDHARLIVAQAQRLQGDLATHARGLSGTVRILSNTAAFSEHLPSAFATFLAGNPTIAIDLEERESGDIGAAIASGACDIGIASRAAVADSLETFAFCTDRLTVVAPADGALADGNVVRFAQVLDRAFVGLPRTSALQAHLARHAASLGAMLKVRICVDGFDAICRMVAAGVGIGIVPETAAARCRHTMPLAVASLDEAWATRALMVCTRDTRTLPLPARRLVEHLRHVAAAITPPSQTIVR